MKLRKGSFGRSVRITDTTTYTDLASTICDIFSFKFSEWNPIISYWMPGKMSDMIASNRPPVYIENQISLDTFMLIRNGDPSVNLFVSFYSIGKGGHTETEVTNVDVSHNFYEDINVDEDDIDEGDEDEYEDEDNEEDEDMDVHDDDTDSECRGSTLDPTIDGSESSCEDYDYNKWGDLIVEEYGNGHVEEDVVNNTQQTVEPTGEFTRLLALCTSTDKHVHHVEPTAVLVDSTPTSAPSPTCQHDLYQCTYTRVCVEETRCEGELVKYTAANVDDIAENVTGDDGIVVLEGVSASGLNIESDDRLVTTGEAYEVYKRFSTLHNGENEFLDTNAAPVFDDLANVRVDAK